MGTTSHFAAPNQPCWTCQHFGHWVIEPIHVWCAHPRAPHVRVMPQCGCASWEREPGSDDEDGQADSQA